MDSIFIIAAGDVVVAHDWRGRSYRDVADQFLQLKTRASAVGRPVSAVAEVARCFCHHIDRDGLVYLGISSSEVDALYALDLLALVDQGLRDYLPKLDAQAIRDNLDVVTELLHELVDDGAPATTYSNALRDIVLSPSLLDRLISVAGLQKYESTAQLGELPWRRAKVKYTNNEIFVDVVEQVRATVDKRGRLVHGAVHGVVRCTSKLSGMPRVTMSLKPWAATSLHTCHPCIERDGFGTGSVSFVPPDGVFELMSYHASLAAAATSSPIPFSVQRVPRKVGDVDGDRFSIALTTRKGTPDSLTIHVPLPGSCAQVRAQSSCGDVRIDRLGAAANTDRGQETDGDAAGNASGGKVVVVWTATNLSKLPSRQTLTLSNLAADDGGSEAAAAALEAGDRYFTHACVSQPTAAQAAGSASAVKVDSLKMTRVGDWKPFKGVKYATQYAEVVFR